jgi:hypothetical protein
MQRVSGSILLGQASGSVVQRYLQLIEDTGH